MRFTACFVLFITMSATFGQQKPAPGTANVSPVVSVNAQKVVDLQKKIEKLEGLLKADEKKRDEAFEKIQAVEKRVLPTTMDLVDKTQAYYKSNFDSLANFAYTIIGLAIAAVALVSFGFLKPLQKKSNKLEADLREVKKISTKAKETAGKLENELQEKVKEIHDLIEKHKESLSDTIYTLYSNLARGEIRHKMLPPAISLQSLALIEAIMVDDSERIHESIDFIETLIYCLYDDQSCSLMFIDHSVIADTLEVIKTKEFIDKCRIDTMISMYNELCERRMKQEEGEGIPPSEDK